MQMSSIKILSLNAIAAATLFLPAVASAFTLKQVLGLFNIVIGLFLVVALLAFGTGMVLYVTRYGTWMREQSFPYMQFGITALFVIIVLLALMRAILEHTTVAIYIAAFAVLLVCAGIAIHFLSKKEEVKKERH